MFYFKIDFFYKMLKILFLLKFQIKMELEKKSEIEIVLPFKQCQVYLDIIDYYQPILPYQSFVKYVDNQSSLT